MRELRKDQVAYGMHRWVCRDDQLFHVYNRASRGGPEGRTIMVAAACHECMSPTRVPPFLEGLTRMFIYLAAEPRPLSAPNVCLTDVFRARTDTSMQYCAANPLLVEKNVSALGSLDSISSYFDPNMRAATARSFQVSLSRLSILHQLGSEVARLADCRSRPTPSSRHTVQHSWSLWRRQNLDHDFGQSKLHDRHARHLPHAFTHGSARRVVK